MRPDQLRNGSPPVSQKRPDLHHAFEKLRSIKDGDVGMVDVIGCGSPAVPRLKELLFERDRSGFHQLRCRVVQALAALGADEVLREFLEEPPSAADPVERLGDDVVVSAAAMALARKGNAATFDLLLSIAKSGRYLPGVVAGLGHFGRKAIPVLVSALAEDECRPYAENALIKLGRGAAPKLLEAALKAPRIAASESESHARQRRSALKLLARMSPPLSDMRDLRSLTGDADREVAILARRICAGARR